MSQWKRELLDNAVGPFESGNGKTAQKSQEEVDTLYREIVNLIVERDFLSRRLERLAGATPRHDRAAIFRNPESETAVSVAEYQPLVAVLPAARVAGRGSGADAPD